MCSQSVICSSEVNVNSTKQQNKSRNWTSLTVLDIQVLGHSVLLVGDDHDWEGGAPHQVYPEAGGCEG